MKVKLKKGLEMKKLSLVATAALLLAAASCKKGSDDGPSAVGGFSAHTESDGGKTELSGKSVLWKSGDNIQVFSGNSDWAKYWATTGAGTTSAYFEMVKKVENYNESAEVPHIAVYPYKEEEAAGMTCDFTDKKIMNFTLPKTQTYAENSFGNGAFPMFAYTDNTDLGFYNLCGVLRLSLYDLPWPVTEITVTAKDGADKLWGTGTVTIGGDGTPTLELGSGNNSVVLKCGDNGVACNGGKSNPTYFHIVLPANVFANKGFKVEVKCNNNYTSEMECTRANKIERSKVTRMPEKEFYCVDLGLPSGRLWAPYNLGVEPVGGVMSATAYGDYYAWGATDTWYVQPLTLDAPGSGSGNSEAVTSTWKTGKDGGYTWVNAPYQTFDSPTSYSNTKWSKYVPSGEATFWWVEDGVPDNKLELDEADDAANVVYGGAWRMPTREDFVELRDNCDIEWTTVGSVNGRMFTSKSNSRIVFFPATGYCSVSSRHDVSSEGVYWSRSLCSSTSGYRFYFRSNAIDPSGNHNRSFGYTVRPVL